MTLPASSAARLVALSHDLMGAIDREGRLTWTNPAWQRVLGWTATELVGRSYAELIHPEDREQAAAAATALAGGEPSWPDTDVRVRARDGSYRSMLFNAVYVPGEQQVFISGKDVSERTRAAAELERSNAELAQFAYVASHDLSEPLRTVSSYLQLLRRRYHGQIDDDADAFIEYAVEGANRMRTLIEDLLAYSRAGRMERVPAPVDLEAVVREVCGTLAAQPARPEIQWDPLPTVVGDANQLKQLFQNLIGNGVKFVSPGVRPRVRVLARPNGEGWRFAVEDNGIGIAPEHAEQVFGMFQRLHTRDQFEGTGIGLAICRKVVQLHGGEIRAVALEQGTRFEFTLSGMRA